MIKKFNRKKTFQIKIGAFGSGDHETTKSCLDFIDTLNLSEKKILDVGAGTGILSIYAAKLGAKFVVGYDISFEACKTFKENLILNGIKSCYPICSDENAINGKFDIIFANIYSDIILNLKAFFNRWLNKKGFLLLSGIPIEENYEIRRKFTDEYELIQSFYGEEYTTFLMKRR